MEQEADWRVEEEKHVLRWNDAVLGCRDIVTLSNVFILLRENVENVFFFFLM